MNLKNWMRKFSLCYEFIFPAALWWIWHDCNNDIFNEDEPWDVEKTTMIIRHLAHEFQNLSSSRSLSANAISTTWEPPPSLVAKFWPVVKGLFCSFPANSIIWCELFGIWHGLVLAWECGLKEIVCETDYLEAYLLVTRDNINMAMECSDLVLMIREVIQRNWVVVVKLIHRTANDVADYLAKQSARQCQPYVELLASNSVLENILAKDLLSLSF
ncbi:hypothetical protein PIB30_029792 [Stylosanthes scabra]|uniref:RNase H type-1 domain-containing protein n=1 Tax=Stylosanthes scabra TaxID=79078 RepID=A0ABU6SBK7_9FABA|nr:hypothetical protein [Stylosanthes scabra]